MALQSKGFKTFRKVSVNQVEDAHTQRMRKELVENNGWTNEEFDAWFNSNIKVAVQAQVQAVISNARRKNCRSRAQA